MPRTLAARASWRKSCLLVSADELNILLVMRIRRLLYKGGLVDKHRALQPRAHPARGDGGQDRVQEEPRQADSPVAQGGAGEAAQLPQGAIGCKIRRAARLSRHLLGGARRDASASPCNPMVVTRGAREKAQ